MTVAAKDVAIKREATTEINETIEVRPALAIAGHAKINLNLRTGPASQLALVLGGSAVEARAEIAAAVVPATIVAATIVPAEVVVASRLDAMAIATEVEAIRNPAIHPSLADQREWIHPSR